MYRLQFLNGKFKGKRLNIQQASLTIGRDPKNNLDIDDDDEVSREHAVIEYRGGSPIIRDLGSINTIEVNNIPVKEHRLRHGDRIEIGRTAIEFLSAKKHVTLERKHRFSTMQAVSFFSIGLIVLLQILFVLLFPLWQKREVVPIDMSRPVAVEPEHTDAVPAESDAVAVADEPELSDSIEDLLGEPLVPTDNTDAGDDPLESVPDTAPSDSVTDIAALEELFKDDDEVEEPAVAETEEAVADPLEVQAQSMLDDAEAEIANGNVKKADNLLERAQMIAPEFVPAWQARAALYEAQGMYREANAQWEEVMRLSPGTPLYNHASEERLRLARLSLGVTPSSPASSPPPAADVPGYTSNRKLEKRIRIHSVERERFQANEEFDEMRMVRITLRPRNGEGEIDSSKVLVVIHFYDRLEGSSRQMLTRALVPKEPITFTGDWAAGESRRTSATYILNKGFREREQEELGEKRTYEGYRVSVYYDGKLQDENAMPRKLLKLPMPPKPEVY